MKTRAFTLIELLVVIAIIAILAAILFPVFAQAKASAKKIQCLSDTKQTGLAFLMYAESYDDVLLNQIWPGGAPATETGYWADCETDGDPNTFGCLPDHWAVLLLPYVKSKGIFDCPTNNDYNYIASFRVWAYGDASKKPLIDTADYQLNHMLFGASTPMTSIEKPAEIGMYGDGQYIFSWNTCTHGPSSSQLRYYFAHAIPDWDYYGKSYHNNGRNFGYADGHSKWAREIIVPEGAPERNNGVSDGYYPVMMAESECWQ